jgi:hypothetical protein
VGSPAGKDQVFSFFSAPCPRLDAAFHAETRPAPGLAGFISNFLSVAIVI